ncbi:hypothetical protein [Brevundimonas faecalis]|uniref:Uncharacterized protein n=1 Tax=Brevundimonas faecalis TaxID=947378 RepID=A0ABV2R8Q3_9CAUL
MAFTDRTTRAAPPKGVETYRTASGRVLVEPPRGSTLKKGEVRKAVQAVKEHRAGERGETQR